ERRRLLYDRAHRHDDQLAIGCVLVHREIGDDVDRLTDLEALDPFAERIDRPRGLIAEPCGQLRRLDIFVVTPHAFRAVEADRLDANADLASGGLWIRDVLELENLRRAKGCKLYDTGHGRLLSGSERGIGRVRFGVPQNEATINAQNIVL